VGVDLAPLDAVDPRLERQRLFDRGLAFITNGERPSESAIALLDIRASEQLIEDERDHATVYATGRSCIRRAQDQSPPHAIAVEV
jgi:hypothetical protein